MIRFWVDSLSHFRFSGRKARPEANDFCPSGVKSDPFGRPAVGRTGTAVLARSLKTAAGSASVSGT